MVEKVDLSESFSIAYVLGSKCVNVANFTKYLNNFDFQGELTWTDVKFKSIQKTILLLNYESIGMIEGRFILNLVLGVMCVRTKVIYPVL